MIILIEGQRDNDEALLPDGYVRWRDAERVLREYPAAFVLPPQNFLDPVEWIELDDGTGFSIDCPLCGPWRRGVPIWRCDSSR